MPVLAPRACAEASLCDANSTGPGRWAKRVAQAANLALGGAGHMVTDHSDIR